MQHILICRPEHYGIDYSINPWMDTSNNIDGNSTWFQWEKLAYNLNKLSKLSVLDGIRGLPDMVFTANAGLVIKGTRKVVLSHFKHKERSEEELHFRHFFEKEHFEIFQPASYFEGAGDALYLGDTLIGGYGFRTDEVFYKEAEDILGDVKTVKLIDPRFYHLDTCFCPLNKNCDYLIYPNAFDQSDLKKIKESGNIGIEVNEEEATMFACNAVVIEDTVILPDSCFDTNEQLQAIGFKTIPIPMTEFIKSGGACKCLTLRLE